MDEIMDKCQYQGKIGEPRVGCNQHWEYSWQPDKTYRPIMLCRHHYDMVRRKNGAAAAAANTQRPWTLEDLVEYADCQGLVDGDNYLAAAAAIENSPQLDSTAPGGLLDQIRYIVRTRGVSFAKSAIDDAAWRRNGSLGIKEIMGSSGENRAWQA